jgi:hypothetical protein
MIFNASADAIWRDELPSMAWWWYWPYDDMTIHDDIWWCDDDMMIWYDMMIWWYDMILIWYDMIWYDMMIWWYDMIWWLWYDMMIWGALKIHSPQANPALLSYCRADIASKTTAA